MNNASTSNELKLTVDTQPMETQLKSTGYATHYTKWRSEWGEAPSNENECDFVMYQFNNNMYDYYHKYSSVTTLFELIPSAPEALLSQLDMVVLIAQINSPLSYPSTRNSHLMTILTKDFLISDQILHLTRIRTSLLHIQSQIPQRL